MRAALELLDLAIAMGREELARLDAGEVDKAADLVSDRDRIIRGLTRDALAQPAAECLDTVIAKLEELKGVQASIIDSARRLQQNIAGDIRRMGREQRRHQGYGRAVRPVHRVRYLYLNREG